MYFYHENPIRICSERKESQSAIFDKFVLSAILHVGLYYSRHSDVENIRSVAIEKRAWETNSGLVRGPPGEGRVAPWRATGPRSTDLDNSLKFI